MRWAARRGPMDERADGRSVPAGADTRGRAGRAARSRSARWACALALAALTAEGCSSCGAKPSDPVRFLGRDAEAVLELPDLGVLVKRRAQVTELLRGLASPDQQRALEQE